jgi:hypothetical protein
VILQLDGRPIPLSFEVAKLNLKQGANCTLTITPVRNDARLDVEIASSGGGVTDHGALSGLADDDHTQYALESALGPLATASYVGTSFPASPSNGLPFVRTDLDYELFYYDTGRTKWLSARTFELAFTNQTTVAAAANLRLFQSVVGSSVIAYLVKWDCVLTEIVSHRVTSGSATQLDLNDGPTLKKAHTIGAGATSAVETALNISIVSGALLNCVATSALTGGGHCIYTFRRTAS